MESTGRSTGEVAAPASNLEGTMIERKVFVFNDVILGIGDTIESALSETNNYSGPDDVLTEADLHEYRGRRNAQSDRIYWASVEVTPEDWAVIERDPQSSAVFDIIERPFAEARRFLAGGGDHHGHAYPGAVDDRAGHGRSQEGLHPRTQG